MRFLINPKTLSLENNNLISENALHILKDKNITLSLDVCDSDRGSDKPIMVFIHGNSSSKKAFKDQIDYFSRTYRIISLDLLGHGDSSKISDIEGLSEADKDRLAQEFYNPCAMIAEITQLLKSLNVEKAHFVGWSLGGHLAYGAAVEAPELVASITSIGSPPVDFSMEGFSKGFQDFFTNHVVPEWIRNTTRNLPNLDKSAELNGYTDCDGKDKFFIEDLIKTDPRMRKFLFLNLQQHRAQPLDGENFVKSTTLPLCLMVGEKDVGINAEYYHQFNNQLKNKASQICLIKDAKHAVFRTHGDEFTATLNNFMASNQALERQNTLKTTPPSPLRTFSMLRAGSEVEAVNTVNTHGTNILDQRNASPTLNKRHP